MVNSSQELFAVMESEIGNLHISNVILQKRVAAVQEENFKLREELMTFKKEPESAESPGTKPEGSGEQEGI